MIIETQHLGKRYKTGDIGSSSLREELELFWNERILGKKIRRSLNVTHDEFGEGAIDHHETIRKSVWAVRNLSLALEEGQSLGIIGKNGSGKSTLLKLLSRITTPTEGRAVVRGRIAALLEVGTGFHPELTGRENIYLNGAILGMKRYEIQQHLKSIIEFAEIGPYVDTPIKRYSSGMTVRLAFAVAAHLQADILIVDEVLAVGDFGFQKKCMDKMKERLREGRTLLFVSHQLQMLAHICPRSIVLESGSCVFDGPTEQAIGQYLAHQSSSNALRLWDPHLSPKNHWGRLLRAAIRSEGKITDQAPIDAPIAIEMEYECLTEGTRLSCAIRVFDRMGTVVFTARELPSAAAGEDPLRGKPFPKGRYKSTCILPANFLNEGYYSAMLHLVRDTTDLVAWEPDALSFYAIDTGSMRKEYTGSWDGVIRPKLEWTCEPLALLQNP